MARNVVHGFGWLSLILATLLVYPGAGCATQQSEPDAVLQGLQGRWEGDRSPGKMVVTIAGNSLRFYARPDFWYETTFMLPEVAGPQQLHATIQDSAPPAKDVGVVVFAIFKMEGTALTLAVDDGSTAPPASFADATSTYRLERAPVADEAP